MPATLAQKLIARAAGRGAVTPGEIVTCKVDLAMIHDSSGPRRLKPMLERLGAKLWDPSKVVLITDHYVPAYDEESRKDHPHHARLGARGRHRPLPRRAGHLPRRACPSAAT
jgi:homoaconitase/3-isopropylmalate dehydratase large subunit